MNDKKMTTLETWLESATRRLSAESAAQVRAEIHEHYQSAYEAALAGGASGQEANLTAIADLGDARSANRQYRRVLLTVKEARLLQFMTPSLSSMSPGRVRAGKWLVGLIMAESLSGVALMCWRDHAWLCFWSTLAAVVFVSRFLPIDSLSRSRSYIWAKWAAFIGAAGLTAWLGVMQPWMLAPPLIVLGYVEYVHTSIRRKLPVDQWPKRLYR